MRLPPSKWLGHNRDLNPRFEPTTIMIANRSVVDSRAVRESDCHPEAPEPRSDDLPLKTTLNVNVKASQ